jgi:hypothetical protein
VSADLVKRCARRGRSAPCQPRVRTRPILNTGGRSCGDALHNWPGASGEGQEYSATTSRESRSGSGAGVVCCRMQGSFNQTASLRLQSGIALCIWGDEGWGNLVRAALGTLRYRLLSLPEIQSG